MDGQRGLSSAEAAARAQRFGPNEFAAGRSESRWHAFLGAPDQLLPRPATVVDMDAGPAPADLWPGLTGSETLRLLGRVQGRVDPAYRDELIARFQLDPSKRVRAYSEGNW